MHIPLSFAHALLGLSPDAFGVDGVNRLGIELQLDEPFLWERSGKQSYALEFLAETGQKVFHLKVGELLTQTDARSVVEGDIFPLAFGFPRFCGLLA